MIEWLTYTNAMWIIGALSLLTYLWVDGKHLLREILTMIFFAGACLYLGMVAVVAFLGVVLAAIIGPAARLICRKDTTTWGGTIICAVTNFCFGWMDKLKAYQDKKIKELQAQRAKLEPDPVYPGNRANVGCYPDGFYKLQFNEAQKPICPDCPGTLAGGPEAGVQMMTKCTLCHAEFMYTQHDGMLERINHERS